MDYFWISQDKRYLYPPIITNLNSIVEKRKDVCREKASRIPNVNVGFAKTSAKIDFIDVLDSQIFVIKEEVKEVFSMYDPDLQFKALCILDNLSGEYGSYYIPVFQEIDCLSAESIVTPDKSYVRKLVLKKVIPEDLAIFKVKGLNTDIIIVRLDVAESLLRRNIKKYKLIKLEIESR